MDSPTSLGFKGGERAKPDQQSAFAMPYKRLDATQPIDRYGNDVPRVLQPGRTFTVSAGAVSDTFLFETVVRVMSTSAAQLKIVQNSNDLATSADMPLPANVPELIKVSQGFRIAAATATISCTVME